MGKHWRVSSVFAVCNESDGIALAQLSVPRDCGFKTFPAQGGKHREPLYGGDGMFRDAFFLMLLI